jgi:hypothetical protein
VGFIVSPYTREERKTEFRKCSFAKTARQSTNFQRIRDVNSQR